MVFNAQSAGTMISSSLNSVNLSFNDGIKETKKKKKKRRKRWSAIRVCKPIHFHASLA